MSTEQPHCHQQEEQEEPTLIHVPDIVGIAESTILKEDLLHMFQTAQEIHVPLDHIKKVTTTFIQTMIVASRHAKHHHFVLKWTAPSKPVIDAFSDLGLYNQLMTMEFN